MVVLAAGMASRFGGPKQLARLGRKTLIERVIESIPKSRVKEVVVVVGQDSAPVRKVLAKANVKVVVNRHYARGMSTSIRAGLRALAKGSNGVMIVLGDQPFVTRPLLEKVLKRYGSGDKIVAVSDGRIVTPPVIFPRAFFEELRKLEGDQGARSVMERHANALSLVKTKAKTLFDIDTKKDLSLARRQLA